MRDYFEYTEKLPLNMQQVLDRYADSLAFGMTYNDCEDMLRECEALGYTFDYDLDSIPYDLHRKNTFANCDDFANYVLDQLTDFGGVINDDTNAFLGLNLPIGTDLYKEKVLPNGGENYAKFGTVKGWLYDYYYKKFK